MYLEPRGLGDYDDSRLLSWDEFLALGAKHRAEHPGAVEARMAEARADDVMTLVYTSGTTGPPKGAMLTNANAAFAIDKIVTLPDRMPDGKVPNQNDLIVTYLPLCHIAERVFSTWHMVSCGCVLNFAESIDTITANLREVQPTLFFAVPRIWEKIHASILIRANDATWLKRKALGFGNRLARSIGREKVANGGAHTMKSRLLYAVGFPLVLRAAEGAHRSALLPLRGLGRGADRPRGARVLHRHRRPGLRAVRHDREHRRGDRQHARVG